MQEHTFQFRPDELAAFASCVDAPGPLYPFAVEPGAETAAPGPDLHHALRVMAAATSAAWVRLAAAGRVLDYGVWSAAEGPAVAMSVAPDQVVIEVPAHGDYVALLAANLLGGSTLRAVDLDVTLSPLAAVVLAAAFDEARRDTLLALAMERPLAVRGVAPTDVLAVMDTAVERDDGLSALVVSALGSPPEPRTADAAQAALNELVGAGLLIREGERAVPAEGLRALAARCGAPSARVGMRQASNPVGADVETAGLQALQFGVHDIISAEYVGATVTVATRSAAEIVDLVGAFLAGAPVPS